MWPANVLKSSQGGNTCSLVQTMIPLARVVWWQTREACLSLGRTCGAAGWENSNSAIKGGSAKSYIRGAEGGPGFRVCWTCGRQENKQIITRRMEKCGRRGEITDFCCSELGQSFKELLRRSSCWTYPVFVSICCYRFTTSRDTDLYLTGSSVVYHSNYCITIQHFLFSLGQTSMRIIDHCIKTAIIWSLTCETNICDLSSSSTTCSWQDKSLTLINNSKLKKGQAIM